MGICGSNAFKVPTFVWHLWKDLALKLRDQTSEEENIIPQFKYYSLTYKAIIEIGKLLVMS